VTLFTNATTGKLYMIVNDTGAHIYEVTLPTLQPFPPVSVDITPQMIAATRPWDPDKSIPVAGSLLNARTSGTDLLISWHTNAASLSLQSASIVTGTWTTVTATRQTNNDTVTVTLPPSGARQFYRLFK
jgi:hypothetical protein